MNEMERKIAQYLLQIKAIELNTENPFTWASGIKSPIYCDNRKVLSYPEIRNFVVEGFCDLINQQYPDVESIAGVATAGIAHAALITWRLNLPMIYVRTKPKGHGLQNQIEGVYNPGQKVVVVEDLISTGKSTLQTVEVLRNSGIEVLGAVAIFTYNFDESVKAFEAADCPFQTLSNFDVLIEEAQKNSYIKSKNIISLKKWKGNRTEWSN